MTDELPRGTVTFVFTDIEGSTRMLQDLGSHYVVVLSEQRRILSGAFATHNGVEVGSEGDSFFVAFGRQRGCLLNRSHGGGIAKMPSRSDRHFAASRPCICAVSMKLDSLDRLYAR